MVEEVEEADLVLAWKGGGGGMRLWSAKSRAGSPGLWRVRCMCKVCAVAGSSVRWSKSDLDEVNKHSVTSVMSFQTVKSTLTADKGPCQFGETFG